MSEERDAARAEVERMIQQIRDRLDDVEDSLGSYEGSLEGYYERLDRIDDRLYEIEEEFERSPVPGGEDAAPCAIGAESPSDANAEDDNEYDPHITREGVQRATSDLNSIYKTGYETVSELSAAMNDIKQAFDFKSALKPKE